MLDDPYRILGVSPSASDDEIKKAYHALVKKYHPDLHPGDSYSAQKMNEVNAAYDAIQEMREKGEAYTGASGYGSSSGYGSYGYGSYRSSNRGYTQYSSAGDTPQLAQVRAMIDAQRYTEALQLLARMPENARTARWYYYSAVADVGTGNRIAALQQAQRAVQLEPNNLEYTQFLDELQSRSRVYQGRGYSMPQVGSLNRLCLGFFVAQMFCSCCSRGCI